LCGVASHSTRWGVSHLLALAVAQVFKHGQLGTQVRTNRAHLSHHGIELYKLLAVGFHLLINTRFHILVLAFEKLKGACNAILRSLDQTIVLGEELYRGTNPFAKAGFASE